MGVMTFVAQIIFHVLNRYKLVWGSSIQYSLHMYGCIV